MTTYRSLAATFRRFLRDGDGATAIEYAIIAGGIAVVIAATVMALGSALNSKYQSVNSAWPN